MRVIFIMILAVFMLVSSYVAAGPAIERQPEFEVVYLEESDVVEAPAVTREVEVTEVVEVEPYVPEPVEEVRYFDVPLSEELQDYIFQLCEIHDIDPSVVVAMIKVESNYRASNMGDNGASYGLMQIQPRWHSERMAKLDIVIDDLLNPYKNVEVGIDFLAELYETGRSTEWVLMTYNGGRAHANRHIKAGTLSKYAQKVLKYRGELVG